MAAIGCVLVALILVPAMRAARATVVTDEGMVEEPVAAEPGGRTLTPRSAGGHAHGSTGHYSHGYETNVHPGVQPGRGAAVTTLTGGGR